MKGTGRPRWRWEIEPPYGNIPHRIDGPACDLLEVSRTRIEQPVDDWQSLTDSKGGQGAFDQGNLGWKADSLGSKSTPSDLRLGFSMLMKQ